MCYLADVRKFAISEVKFKKKRRSFNHQFDLQFHQEIFFQYTIYECEINRKLFILSLSLDCCLLTFFFCFQLKI